MKLDRTKPYGTVHGSAAAFYEQDGKLFGHDERLLGDHPVDVVAVDEAVVVKKKLGRPAKADAVDPQLESQLKD